MTPEEIERIIFYPIDLGQRPYKLNHVPISHPYQNVSGLVRIEDQFYKVEYLKYFIQPTRDSTGISFLDKFIGLRLF